MWCKWVKEFLEQKGGLFEHFSARFWGQKFALQMK